MPNFKVDFCLTASGAFSPLDRVEAVEHDVHFVLCCVLPAFVSQTLDLWLDNWPVL